MIPKRVEERLIRSIGKFKQILKIAKDRDVNETDTVSIIKDILAEVFGYDKYLDITSEFAVRGTFCDLAIKIDNKIEFLIEAKAIGIELKEPHLRQALDYCANSGVQWAVLTNSIVWRIYKIRFEQPINADEICTFDILAMDPQDEEQQGKLFILCKEGLSKDAREEFHEKILTINRFLLGALILSDEVISTVRRELRKISGGVIVSPEEIQKVLTNEVLKRDIIEGDDALKAQARIRKYYGKLSRRTKDSVQSSEETSEKVEEGLAPDQEKGKTEDDKT
jgi:predicted type IV restriction endonuclease